MKCFMCSASIPDGVSTCPECGARIVSGGANETKATEKSWKELVNSSKMNEDEKSYLGRAYGSLYNLSICKIVMAVLCTIVVGVMFYLVIDFSGAAKGLGFYRVFSTISEIIEVVISIIILIQYVRLSEFEERFGTVYRLFVAALLIGFITNFISNEAMVLVMKICKIVIEIIYVYHFYGAMADITCPFSESISDKWDLLFKIYVVEMIISLIMAVYGFIAIMGLNVSAYLVSLFIVTILKCIMIILEMIFLKKTVTVFENIEE